MSHGYTFSKLGDYDLYTPGHRLLHKALQGVYAPGYRKMYSSIGDRNEQLHLKDVTFTFQVYHLIWVMFYFIFFRFMVQITKSISGVGRD